MKSERRFFCVLRMIAALTALVALAVGTPVQAQLVLSVDVNDPAALGNTQPGFNSLNRNDGGTDQAVATFGGITIDVDPFLLAFDDRVRATPADGGALTTARLYQDFFFGNGEGSGLDIRLSGLTPGQAYAMTVWSFDSGSPGNRISDWFVNGGLQVDNYTFNGSFLPDSDGDYTMFLAGFANGSGEILISGRTELSAGTDFNVFFNAIQVTAVPEPTSLAAVLVAVVIGAWRLRRRRTARH